MNRILTWFLISLLLALSGPVQALSMGSARGFEKSLYGRSAPIHHKYAYCSGDPINFSDPSGLDEEGDYWTKLHLVEDFHNEVVSMFAWGAAFESLGMARNGLRGAVGLKSSSGLRAVGGLFGSKSISVDEYLKFEAEAAQLNMTVKIDPGGPTGAVKVHRGGTAGQVRFNIWPTEYMKLHEGAHLKQIKEIGSAAWNDLTHLQQETYVLRELYQNSWGKLNAAEKSHAVGYWESYLKTLRK